MINTKIYVYPDGRITDTQDRPIRITWQNMRRIGQFDTKRSRWTYEILTKNIVHV